MALLKVVALIWLACPGSAAPVPHEGERVATVLGLTYGVPGRQILALRARGLSWDDLALALVLSRRTGRPLKTLVWLRDSGLPWDEIARRTGVDPVSATLEAREVSRIAGGGAATKAFEPLEETR